MHSPLLLLLALPVSLPGFAAGQSGTPSEWPGFLGPSGDNSYRGAELETNWGPNGPPVAWTADVGPGFGGVAVSGGEVFLVDRIRGEADLVRCLSFEDGSQRWELAYEALGRLSYAGSRAAPTVTGEHVYTTGPMGPVHCIDRETGEVLWSIDQAELFNQERPYFGWCQAPLVVGDLLILAPLGTEVGLAAVERSTGETVWTTPTVGQGHSSPTLIELNGRAQVLMVSAMVTDEERSRGQLPEESLVSARTGRGGLISSFDPRTGRRLWHSFAPACTSPVAPALRVDDSRVFVTGGYLAGSVLLEITQDGGEYSVSEVFRHRLGSSVHPAVRWGDHLFLTTTENFNEPRSRWDEAGLMCLGLDGEERWRTGADPNFGRGSVLVAKGVLVTLDGHDGVLRLIEATGDGYHVLAEAAVFPEERRREARMWAPMALADGRLLLRSEERLKCLDLRRD